MSINYLVKHYSAEKAVIAILESITGSLQKGDNVQVPGFGTFIIKQRQATIANNFSTGEKMQIPAKRMVAFNPGKALKEAVANFYTDRTEPGRKTSKKAVVDKALPKLAVAWQTVEADWAMRNLTIFPNG